MVLFNHATRELTAKIVYYGPGLCGKTTNLLVIFDKLDPKSRGKMLSLATKTDRTLFFDLLPVDIGKVGPFNLKIQLYTVPGQVFYNQTRKLVLKGADSIVFVADSQPSMVDSNRESFNNLLENLEENEIDVDLTPIVIQYNKRDIPGVLPVEELAAKLGFEGFPFMEASALKGDGVMETFKLASKVTAKHLVNKVKGKPAKVRDWSLKGGARPAAAASGGAAPPDPEPVETEAPAAEVADDQEVASPFEGAWGKGADEAPPFETTAPPFDEAAMDADYEAVEEVSLEQLLEGRERPTTIGGQVPIPVEMDEPPEEIEELDEVEAIDESAMIAAPVPDSTGSPDDLDELRRRLAELEGDRQRLRDGIARIADELTKLLE